MLCSDKSEKKSCTNDDMEEYFFFHLVRRRPSVASKLAARSEALHSVLHLYSDFLFLFLAAAAMSTVSDTWGTLPTGMVCVT